MKRYKIRCAVKRTTWVSVHRVIYERLRDRNSWFCVFQSLLSQLSWPLHLLNAEQPHRLVLFFKVETSFCDLKKNNKKTTKTEPLSLVELWQHTAPTLPEPQLRCCQRLLFTCTCCDPRHSLVTFVPLSLLFIELSSMCNGGQCVACAWTE